MFIFLNNLVASANTPAVRFIENKGQWEKEIKFLAYIPGGILQIREGRLHYVFVDNNALYEMKHSKQTEAKKPLKAHGLDVIFEDFNPNFTVSSKNPITESQNFFMEMILQNGRLV